MTYSLILPLQIYFCSLSKGLHSRIVVILVHIRKLSSIEDLLCTNYHLSTFISIDLFNLYWESYYYYTHVTDKKNWDTEAKP